MATTLFFDLDGTLMVNPFWSVVFPTVSKVLADQTGKTPEQMFDAIMGEHDRRLLHPLEDKARTMDWEDIIQTTARAHNALYDGTAEELVVAHAAPPYTNFLDTAPKILAQVKQGRRLVVATMGLSKYQFPVMKALGLYDFFEDFLTPDLTDHLKIERGFYRGYPDEAGLRIHIGDRYDHDCFFPKQFGSKSILRLPIDALREHSPFERPQMLDSLRDEISGAMDEISVLPDAVICHLDELPAVVEQIEDTQ